jgi:hypothetical protein
MCGIFGYLYNSTDGSVSVQHVVDTLLGGLQASPAHLRLAGHAAGHTASEAAKGICICICMPMPGLMMLSSHRHAASCSK